MSRSIHPCLSPSLLSGPWLQERLCPKAEGFYLAELSIPIYPAMTEDDIEYVIETIEELL